MDVPSGRIGPRNPHTEHDFDQMYAGTPAWDIGRPQSAFAALADTGALQGNVLDAGCGTAEHALMAAERGLDASMASMTLTIVVRLAIS